jgi:hypothetical protein
VTREGLHWVSSRWVLWLGLLLSHAWLCFVSLYRDDHPLGDVTLVYLPWMQYGFDTHHWVGLDTPWVYPILAIVPMLLAFAFGPENYVFTWLGLVIVLDAVAFGYLIGWTRRVRNTAAAWWWLGFLALLGPIAVARLDSVTVPVAIIGMLFALTRPTLAAMILTVAAWVKVWPGALLVALVIAVQARWRILASALVSSAVIVGIALVLGSGSNVFSFVTQQSTRGLQVEAPVSTFWLWQAFARVGNSHVYYDRDLLTFQVRGDGVATVSAVMTPVLAVAVFGIILLAVRAVVRRASVSEVLPPLGLALVTAVIAVNKVGSPQYVSWLAVPVIFGLVLRSTARGRSFRVPAAIVAVLALLTQLIYPWFYDQLLSLNPAMLVVLTARNLLQFVLLGWAVAAVWAAGKPGEKIGSNVTGLKQTHTTQVIQEG